MNLEQLRKQASPERFVLAATSGRRDRADAMLAASPRIAEDRWAALVLGHGWDGDPNQVGGPRDWPPLHYVTQSVYRPIELGRRLLSRGAEPNAFVTSDSGGQVSPLFGAAGVLHDPELTRMLLDAGADPNGEPWFGDALYHSVEAEDTACLRVLLEHGARPSGTNALMHALDYDRIDAVRTLLDAGADPNDGPSLVHAVRRGRGPRFLRLLAEGGAELDRKGGEWSTPEEEYRTAYQNAVLRGLDEAAAVLAELGASTEVSPEDAAVAAVVRGERPTAPLPAELGSDAQEALILAAFDDKFDLVVDLVGPNYFGYVGGGPPGTLLHHASWLGDAEAVGKLLERGADPEAGSPAEFVTPAAWAALGSQYYELPGRDYVGVLEQLVAAGAQLEPRYAEVAHGPLEDWLADQA
jgi:ankyrin repeat protein